MDKESLKKLLMDDKVEEVLLQLLSSNQNNISIQKEILIVNGKLSELNKRERLGLISSNEILLERNKIRNSVIELIEPTKASVSYNFKIEDYFNSINYKERDFKILVDIHVARYMEEPSASEQFLSTLFRLFGDKTDINEHHYTNCFDWDGYSIYTSCDCTLAYNKWNASNGNHIERRAGSDESYSTLFLRVFNSWKLFGNGIELYLSKGYGKLIKLTNNSDQYELENLTTTKKTDKAIISVKSKREELDILMFCNQYGKNNFNFEQITINKNIIKQIYLKDWKVKFIEEIDKLPLAIIYSIPMLGSDYKFSDYIIVNLFDGTYTYHSIDDTLQDISISPDNKKIAFIGNRISILKLDNHKIDAQVDLTVVNNSNHKRVIEFSPCGRFLATISNISGDLEIRDSEHLNIIESFSGFGTPYLDLSWDYSSHYIAVRYEQNSSEKTELLLVWNIRTQREVLKEEACQVTYSDFGFKWSESESKIALLVKNKRIKVFGTD